MTHECERIGEWLKAPCAMALNRVSGSLGYLSRTALTALEGGKGVARTHRETTKNVETPESWELAL